MKTSTLHFFSFFSSQFLGIHFKLDPSSSPDRELAFSRDLTMAKLTGQVSSTVLGDVTVHNGRHYWKLRVDQFTGAKNSGYIAVGVANTAQQDQILGNSCTCRFLVQLVSSSACLLV